MSSLEVENYFFFYINIKEIWANGEKSHEAKTIKRSRHVNAEGLEVLLCEVCWHITNVCTRKTPESFIPPTLTTRLTRHLTPQGHRAWPQTSYWLLTMVEWSVHIPTLIHCVQKTQQRKNSGFRVSGGLRTAESVRCIFPVLSSLLTACCIPQKHRNSQA